MISMDPTTPVQLTSKEPAPRRDEQLVFAALAGSSDAFEELHNLYSKRLYCTIVSITKCREDAEDALQDTFLRAYRSLPRFEGRSSFYSWLTRIAINSALMVLRKRRACPEVPVDPPLEAGGDIPWFEVEVSDLNPEQIYDQRQRCAGMVRTIRRLEPALRGPIQIRMASECSAEEMARALNLSVAAVKSKLFRARKRLARSGAFRGLAKRKNVRSSRDSKALPSGIRVEDNNVRSANVTD